ncbi:hypothetical protein Cgig2_029208 [Carnegiea gigantea]|uniref:J domain-containing protein n=1 Tax=Carnegiea gigantea TaxID=171969 RepID=A0A9Q1KLJ1_9CARY|nr:hypothetical protein Cgig2_029208 [Carnegiea gigantea]
MKRVKQQQPHDVKSHSAIETCNIYQNAHFPCIHTDNNPLQSPFIDWYLILRVEEDASIDTIRKQYYEFALLLHPDKNKHPKAQFAFRLISQAYKCLSDEARRTSFHLERWTNLCRECISNRTYNADQKAKASSTPTRHRHRHLSPSDNILQQFRAITEQLEEEVRVIQSCIRIHRSSGHKYPVFDPSNYAHLGYPHIRRHHYVYCDRSGGRRCESPVFEHRTDCSSFVLVHSRMLSRCLGLSTDEV